MSDQQHPPEQNRDFLRRRTLHINRPAPSSHSVPHTARRWTINLDGSKTKRDGGVVQDSYSCYDGLTWETLKGYLEHKWPGGKFTEKKRNDFWVFEVPEPLTEEDRVNIAALRDRKNIVRRNSVSDSE